MGKQPHPIFGYGKYDLASPDDLTNNFLKFMRNAHPDIMNQKDSEALKTTLAGYAQLINPDYFFDIITRDWK